ncbi:MAG: SDR family NAD(P)-dependent oxidoreductase [Candidatus Delongbacteria bacterium]
MTWQDRTVLVTGAGGFIGRHLCRRLLAEGARLRILLRYVSQPAAQRLPEDILRQAEVHRGDVGDTALLRAALQNTEVVFHLAALVGIPYSYACPAEVFRVNAGGTLALLEAARQQRPERVVLTSTSEVYGSAQQVPMPEDHPLCAQSPYAASKIAADQLGLAYHRSFGLPVAVLRPFNTYGPGQSGRAVIPSILGQALAGGELQLGATETTRDFNYVDDTVEAFLAAGHAPLALGRVTTYGSGRETSIDEVIRLAGGLLGRELGVVQDPARRRPAESEVLRLCCDPEPARRVLGVSARVPLEEGLSRTLEWLRGQPQRPGGSYDI